MKLRFLHYLLKDKDDYQKDDKLKQRWDLYKYLLGYMGKESLSLLKDKLLYFVKEKKISLLKRLAFILTIVLIVYFGGKFSGNYIINYFGLQPKMVYNTSKIDEYIPDTIPVERRIKDLSKILSISTKEVNKKFNFITVYTVDSTKTLKKFLERLGQIESGKNYKSRRPGSQYLGYWQMGDGARRSVGFGNISYDKFLNTPEIQDAAVVLYLKSNYSYMKPYLKKYDNKIIRGYHLTTSGMLAMAHNVGPGAVMNWLKNNCPNDNVPKDGNGRSDRFLILGNYNLSSLNN